LFGILSTTYDVFYVGVYTVLDSLCIYMHTKNVISCKPLLRILESLGIEVSSIRLCKIFTGSVSSEHGKKFSNGVKYKDPDTTEKSPGAPCPIPNENSLCLPERQPPTSLPKPCTPIANCKIIEHNIYKDVASGDSGPDSFHAVWSSKGGLWYPMMWVGPLRNINSRGIEKRSSLKPWMVDELYERQDHECRLCQTGVFTGTFSNSDVDHIVPLKHGGSSCLSNLQVLCVTCHRRKTALECKKIVTMMGDPDADWDPSKIYLTNTHVHYVPGSAQCSGSLDALVHLEEKHGVFEMVG
jgi:5-methylcytosine-specific restriction endonuclease McrA